MYSPPAQAKPYYYNQTKINTYRHIQNKEKIHACGCRSLICEFTESDCVMGAAFSTICWIPGTILCTLPSASSTMVVWGKALVGIAAGVTGLIASGRFPTTCLMGCANPDTGCCIEEY